MAEQSKSTEVTMADLVKERKRLLNIPEKKRTLSQKVLLIGVNSRISDMNKAKLRRKQTSGGRASEEATKTARTLDPGKEVSPDIPESRKKAASPDADFNFASTKTKKAAEALALKKKRDEAAVKKAKAAAAAAKKSVPTVKKQSLAQKKVAESLSDEPTSTPDQRKSSDTLGMAAKAAKAAEKKRELEALYTVDPSISKIDTIVVVKRNKDGMAIQPEASTVSAKQAKKVQDQIDEAESGGAFGPTAGRKAIQDFFLDTFGIDDIKVDYKFPGDKGYGEPDSNSNSSERQYRKSGGKVTAKRAPTKRAAVKRPTTKKYAMSRGGKVASVRKPTRA